MHQPTCGIQIPVRSTSPLRTTTPELLVVGTSIDPHIGEVLRYLPESLSVCRIDLDLYPLQTDILYESDGDLKLTYEGRSILGPNLVWFRRLGAPGVSPQLSEGASRFVKGEVEQFLSGVMSVINPRTWINEYWQCRRATSKLLQYEVARRIGLSVPDTLVTTDFQSVLAFGAPTGEWLYKTLHAPIIDYGDHRTITYSQRISALDEADRDAIAVAPCQFQRYQDKAFELRITSIGKRHIAARVDSQALASAAVDWRADANALSYEWFELPDHVTLGLDTLMTELGIDFGASDWIVTPDGDFIFLETNPHGAWMWIEEHLHEPRISRAIASHITMLALSDSA